MKGFFQLNKPKDLLAKLEHDFRRISAAGSDPYPAFDFFVTAEQILDWMYPGASGRERRAAYREQEPLLQVVSHIATGAKHMVPEAPHHTSVERTEAVGTPYGSSPFGSDSYGFGPLVVHLDEATTAQLGYSSITTFGLAHQVLAFWKANIDKRPAV